MKTKILMGNDKPSMVEKTNKTFSKLLEIYGGLTTSIKKWVFKMVKTCSSISPAQFSF